MNYNKPYYAFGTSFNHYEDPVISVIANGLKMLKQQINNDGTWGDKKSLDKLVTTNHCVMTFLSVGFSHDSYLLRNAIDYLEKLNTDQEISFFWRAGTLLNIPKYKHIVESDANYIWHNRKSIGIHPKYPLPYFLLKLVLFNNQNVNFNFDIEKLIDWVIEDFDKEKCWYDKPSITSMACSILYHFDFLEKKEIISQSINFLEKKFKTLSEKSGYFDKNIVDDCFTIYNLFETDFIDVIETTPLYPLLLKVVERILEEITYKGHITSEPPFGGNVAPILYPTAVALRALIAYKAKADKFCYNKIGNSLINNNNYFLFNMTNFKENLKPIIDKIKFENSCKKIAFIMMPFTKSKQHDEIVLAIRQTLSEHGIVGLRADDKEYADNIFDNIMAYIHASDFGIAIFERINDEYFNPNVSLEVGCYMGLEKQICLLKEKTLKNLPTDLVGKLYKPFDMFEISKTINIELIKWLKDKDFI